jgi:LPXTG-motif cell wall-anchored protein
VSTTTTWLILVGAAAMLAVGIILFTRLRKPQEEPVYHFRCPGCRRKLKYRARQAGHRGMCPQCRQQWTFPAVPEGR